MVFQVNKQPFSCVLVAATCTQGQLTWRWLNIDIGSNNASEQYASFVDSCCRVATASNRPQNAQQSESGERASQSSVAKINQHVNPMKSRKRTRRSKKHNRTKKKSRGEFLTEGESNLVMEEALESPTGLQLGEHVDNIQSELEDNIHQVGLELRSTTGSNGSVGDCNVGERIMSDNNSPGHNPIVDIPEEIMAQATTEVASSRDSSGGLDACHPMLAEEPSDEELRDPGYFTSGSSGRAIQYVTEESINLVIEDLILDKRERRDIIGSVSIAEMESAARSLMLSPSSASFAEDNWELKDKDTSEIERSPSVGRVSVSMEGTGYFSTNGMLDLNQAVELGGLLVHYDAPMNETESHLINAMRAEFMSFWLERFYEEPEKMSRISHGNRGLKGLSCTQANVYWNSTIKQFILFSMRLSKPDIRSPQAYWAVVGVKSNVLSYLKLRKGRHGTAPLSASTLNNIFHHLLKAVYLYNICYNPNTKDKPHVRCEVEMYIRALGSLAGRLKNQSTFERRQKRRIECTVEEEGPTTQEVGHLFSRLLWCMQAILEMVLPKNRLCYEVVPNEHYTKHQQYSLGKWSFITTSTDKLIAHLKESAKCEQAYRLLQQLTVRYQQLLYTAIRISAPCRRCKPFAHMLLYSSQKHADKDSRYSGERNVLYDPKKERFHLELVEDKRPGGSEVTMPVELTKYIIFWISMLRPALVVRHSHPYFFSRPNGKDGLDPQRTGQLFQAAIRQVYSNSNRTFDQRDLRRWCSSYGISSGLVDEYAAAMNHHPSTARQIYAPQTQESLATVAIEHYQHNVLESNGTNASNPHLASRGSRRSEEIGHGGTSVALAATTALPLNKGGGSSPSAQVIALRRSPRVNRGYVSGDLGSSSDLVVGNTPRYEVEVVVEI